VLHVRPAYVGRKRRGDPDFLYAAPPMFACAAFSKESRMKFLDSTKPHRKPGGSPHRCFGHSDAKVSAVAPLWENNGNQSSSSQVPGFPVEVGGVVELHAAFLKESRTRGPVWCSVTGNPGFAGANLGHPALRLGAVLGCTGCGSLSTLSFDPLFFPQPVWQWIPALAKPALPCRHRRGRTRQEPGRPLIPWRQLAHPQAHALAEHTTRSPHRASAPWGADR
jgi:hypothetical protein